MIFDLGYDPKLFGSFDSSQRSGRSGGSNERISKKYQWTVCHELLARVSDQYRMKDRTGFGEPANTLIFQGPWNPFVRDIDPSSIIQETYEERYRVSTLNWWYKTEYNHWEISNKDWIYQKTDLPKFENIIEVKDSLGNAWVWLEIHPEWNEPQMAEECATPKSKKQLWYQIRSYLVRKEDSDILDFSFNNGLVHLDFNETRSLYQVFSRQYYW